MGDKVMTWYRTRWSCERRMWALCRDGDTEPECYFDAHRKWRALEAAEYLNRLVRIEWEQMRGRNGRQAVDAMPKKGGTPEQLTDFCMGRPRSLREEGGGNKKARCERAQKRSIERILP